MPRLFAILSTVVLTIGFGAIAEAQVGPPRNNIRPPRATPTVSPYLSLLNRNNSLAFNYYELYRPQVEFRNAYRQLNQDVSQLNERVTQQETAFQRMQLGPTGHSTSFMNYGRYYPTMGR